MSRNVILGTAGHIDHGKSSLVKALTGTDPDRLKEEKERGITIDLGFADLVFPDGVNIGIVDVPGHERLIRNMLAGAGGIDMVVMVIAADEGVMPQSREHLAICNLLGIERGLVALTKTDLVEEDWVDLVSEDIRSFLEGSFLEGAEVIPVSAKSGANLDALKGALHDMAAQVPLKSQKGVFRLPIDRVFTLKGFGTVVTGTALSGRVSVDDPLEILPGGKVSKVRGLQSHGQALSTGLAGQRIAVNLQAVEKSEIVRGDVLTVPGKLRPTRVIDARIRLLRDAPALKSRTQIHFHTGTAETVARVVLYEVDQLKPGQEAFCQLRLDTPVVAMAGDRFVARRFSPLITMGGGVVLDPSPRRRRRADGVNDLETFSSGPLQEIIETKIRREGIYGISMGRLEGWMRGDVPDISASVAELSKKGRVLPLEDHLVHADGLDIFRGRVLERLKKYHKDNPRKPGMPKEELRGLFPGLSVRVFSALLSRVREAAVEQELVRSAGFRLTLSSSDEAGKERLLDLVSKGGLQPPFLKEIANAMKIPERTVSELLKILSKEDKLKRINDSVFVSAEAYADMLNRLREFFRNKSEMTVAEFRDVIGTSRKYALPFLEHLDAARVTLRTGDVRKLLLKD